MIALPDEAQGALAVGWATVELDRAASELAHLLAPGSVFSDAPRSAHLGARCWVGPAAGYAARIVLLEPDTEGRVAATLARSGEGWAATWTLPESSGTSTVSPARPGPLGDERLLLGGLLAGPYRLIVEAVPSPP